MKNKIIKLLCAVLSLFNITACAIFKSNQNVIEHYMVAYDDKEIDKNALDAYFLNHEDLYPSYKKLKKNVPNLLENVKSLQINDLQLFRFSNTGNGFLDSDTFIYNHQQYYHLGTAWGGFGVTEFINFQTKNNHWLYFIYSYGSGIHRTEIGVFDLNENEFYMIEELNLTLHEDYTFVIDEKEHSIDLYEAKIRWNFDDGFDTHTIIKGDLAFKNIDNLEKIKI